MPCRPFPDSQCLRSHPIQNSGLLVGDLWASYERGLAERAVAKNKRNASTACAINTNFDMIGPQVRPILSTHQTIERHAGDETALLATTTQKTEQNTPYLFLRDGFAFALDATRIEVRAMEYPEEGKGPDPDYIFSIDPQSTVQGLQVALCVAQSTLINMVLLCLCGSKIWGGRPDLAR